MSGAEKLLWGFCGMAANAMTAAGLVALLICAGVGLVKGCEWLIDKQEGKT